MPRHTPSLPHRRTTPCFRKHLLALAAGTALTPTWALDLAQEPPGTVVPYIRPNVILSLDDSTSMNTGMNDANGNYLGTRRQVLMKAVKETFNDTNLLPDGKIRLAWQSMNECTQLDGKGAGDLLKADDATATTSTKINLMRLYEGTHRSNFIRYIDAYRTRSQSGWSCNSGTFTHSLVKAADAYMRAPTHKNGPWSSNPGGSDDASTEYLGCRRNYQIVLTDGEWNSGMANVPGSQKNYDGERSYWPSNVPTATDAQTQLYRDRSETYSSIADWAFYSWANPLRPEGDLKGRLETSIEYRNAPATETFENRVTKAKATLERFWNPRYNPATWPHLVTYTIGFSEDALPETNYKWNGSYYVADGAITKPTSLVPYGYDGNFADYANGTYRWRASSDKGHDMWHAALNGRGHFYAVEKGEDLKKAFQEIIGNIKTATDPDMTSTATSGSNSSRTDVGKYTGNYEPKNHWKGFVTAKIVKKDGTTIDNPSWGGKTTADKMDAMSASDRKILTWNDKRDNTGKETGGTPFKWSNGETNLSTAQKKQLGVIPGDPGDTIATNAKNRLEYIRGESTYEGIESPVNYPATKPFRQRKSKQGDIINSVVWYTGAPSGEYTLKGYSSFLSSNRSRPAMIYVGGNDGMLHGFSAADGSEKIAYVPKGIIPGLYRLTESTYNAKGHRNFVDGSPMTGDVDMGTGVQDPDDPDYNPDYAPKWRTLLVGTLGAGGRGYFVLDVTNPNTFDDTSTIAKEMVILDRTRSTEINSDPDCSVLTSTAKTDCEKTLIEDKDVGHITAPPVLDDINPTQSTQITRMNNNRWAVVLGNGYNSENQRPVLLVQYLDNNKELLRIPVVGTVDVLPTIGTGLAKDNGLSAPRLVDINSDGRPDVAYAGDNQGNLWKFDLTNVEDTKWKVAFNGSPLFTALGPIALNATTRTVPQPITVAPTAVPNDRQMEVGSGASKTTVNVGGMMVSFGTGRNVDKNDPSDINVQSIYSVLDNTRYRTVNTSKGKRLEVHPGGGICTPIPLPNCAPVPLALGTGVDTAKLVKRSVTDSSSGEYGTMDAITSTDILDKTTWKDKNGWYMDLPNIGERLLKNLSLYDNSNILTIFSQIPAKGSNKESNKESCDAVSPDEERQFLTMVNIMDGKKPSVQLMDIEPDGVFDDLDKGANRMKISKGSNTIIATGKDTNTLIDNNDKKKLLARLPEQSMRPSWRQLK